MALAEVSKRKRHRNYSSGEGEDEEFIKKRVKKVKSGKLFIDIEQTESIEINEKAISFNDKKEKPKDLKNPYRILGSDSFPELPKLKSIPSWVEYPTTFSVNLSIDSSSLSSISNIDPEILLRVREIGSINSWFPVQSAILPVLFSEIRTPTVLPPRDICVSAPTGSGKTLCYVLPILQSIRHRLIPCIRALILLPVQDLAQQVYGEFEKYNSFSLKIQLLTGNMDYRSERKSLRKNDIDILVATPGRLLDHLVDVTDQKVVILDQLRCEMGVEFDYLVIDEADRMQADIRSGWFGVLERNIYESRPRPGCGSISALIKSNNPPLQKLLFSATLSKDVQTLSRWNLCYPRLFRPEMGKLDKNGRLNGEGLDRNDTKFVCNEEHLALPFELKQFYSICNSTLKPLALFELIKSTDSWQKVLCFVNTRQSGNRLSFILSKLAENSFFVLEMTANLFLRRRRKILKNFADGKIRVLVCTDLVARGIDFDNVNCVVNYDPPIDERSFIHRAGRTARAGHNGTVVSIVTDSELRELKKMLEKAGLWINVDDCSLKVETKNENYAHALSALKANVMKKTGSRKKW